MRPTATAGVRPRTCARFFYTSKAGRNHRQNAPQTYSVGRSPCLPKTGRVWVSSSHPCLWFWKRDSSRNPLPQREFPPKHLQSELLLGRLALLPGTGQKTSLLCSCC